MTTSRSNLRIAAFGAGKLAQAVLPCLSRAGHEIRSVISRNPAGARRLARKLEGTRAVSNPADAIDGAELVLLAVPDGALHAVVSQLATLDDVPWKSLTFLHHAGALGLDRLEPLRERGAAVGLLHPLQCLGDPELASTLLPGSFARIEGRGRGRKLALRIAKDLELVPLRMPAGLEERDRIAYHAAASLLSNDLVALLALGTDLLAESGLSRNAARRALARLALGTWMQLDRSDESAMTGPVVRGDAETLAAHLDRLRDSSAAAAEVHRLLSERMLSLAQAAGTPRERQKDLRLARVLRRPTAGRRRPTGL